MPTATIATDRPAAYHKRGRSKHSPWFLALRRLWQRGFSDPLIAEALADLSAADIHRLEREQRWQDVAKERAGSPEAGEPWTTRQVRYWRTQLGLTARRVRRAKGCLTLNQAREQRQNVFASNRGFAHLVGRSAEIDTLLDAYVGDDPNVIAAALGWTVEILLAWIDRPWDTLRPVEALILTVLDRAGPKTLPELELLVTGLWNGRIGKEFAVTRKPPRLDRGHEGSWLATLLRKRLVRVLLLRPGRRGRPVRVYDLAHGLHAGQTVSLEMALSKLARKSISGTSVATKKELSFSAER